MTHREQSLLAEVRAHEALHRRQRALVLASVLLRPEAAPKDGEVRR
jgi:hypothetical protein